jgi:DNA gyrase subunit B
MTAPRLVTVRAVVGTYGGGSSRPLRVETDSGPFVLKLLHGAEGPRALAAEWIVGGLARVLGFAVPEIAILDFDAALASTIVDQEVRENAQRGAGLCLGLRELEGARPARLYVRRTEHGTAHEKALPPEFFASAEYGQIAELGRTLQGLVGEGAHVVSGNQRREIGSFKEAINWLFDQARKGQTMQRYKGLGEMNPEQLWETTINPETRRLLQVRIEEAIAADDIFNTLMGDQVEPRREFIEKNALAVSNLDV